MVGGGLGGVPEGLERRPPCGPPARRGDGITALTPGPSPAGRGGSGARRGDGRNMLRPYGLAATYPSQLLRGGSGARPPGEECVGVGGAAERLA